MSIVAQSSKRQCVQFKGYEMRGSPFTSSWGTAQHGDLRLCPIFLCSTEKKFKTFKILFSTRLIRESDNFLHIILFSIHFFERTPLKHVEKKHGFEVWRVTVAPHTHTLPTDATDVTDAHLVTKELGTSPFQPLCW